MTKKLLGRTKRFIRRKREKKKTYNEGKRGELLKGGRPV